MENRILKCLPSAELKKLQKYLEPVDLPVRMQLERANKKISHVYFLESGLASVMAGGPESGSIEVGMIGNEGATGLALVLNTDRTPTETFMQTPGHGQRISAEDVAMCMDENASLRNCLLQYVHIFLVQASQTCLANGSRKLEERLARWLLMAHDRVSGDELSLTHEFLSNMLGVRRPGITVAVQLLERRGLIRRKRGQIIIVDRRGLERESGGSYGVAEAETERLFG